MEYAVQRMPKVVDHQARRREIVDALFRVAVRDGLAAASIRTIAKEAGVPAPRVQYYFPTKAALFDGAMTQLGQVLVGRGMALQAAAGPDASPETMIRAALAGSQPVDDETRQSTVLFFLFLVAALTETDEELPVVAGQRFIHGFFVGWVRDAQARGEADPTLDPEHEARLILAANTGLMMSALLGIHTVEEAIATMDHHLRRVFSVQQR
jgi:TetR/AcrR family transcriptional repressor of bet genes